MKQIRVITLGDYNKYFSYFLYGSMEGTFRNGAWHRPVSLFGQSLEAIKEQIDFFKPHVILCHCIFNRKPHNRDDVFELLKYFRKTYGTKIFYHMGDARDEPRYPNDISDIVDFCLVNNLQNMERWSKIWNAPCYHWPYACLYQSEINDIDNDFKAELTFTGSLTSNKHHKARWDFINDLQKRINIKTYPDIKYGNSRFLTPEVSASSTAVLGFQMGNNIHGYQDVRPFQYIGAGALYMHDNHENMDLFFVDKTHYVSFKRDDINNFIIEYNEFAKDKKINRNIRKLGFEYCQKYHSTKVRMKLVLDLVNDKEPILTKTLKGQKQ